MNILIACEDFRVGGAQVFCLNLGKALEKNHKVYVYSQYKDYVDLELVRHHYPGARIIVPNIPMDKIIRKVDTMLYKFNIDWSLRQYFVIRHIQSTLNHLNIQLVHSNMLKSDYLFCKAMKKNTIPLVITMHGNYETFLSNIRRAKGEIILNYIQKTNEIVKRINGLVYLTKKNLCILEELDSNGISSANNILVKKIYNGFTNKKLKSFIDGKGKLGIQKQHTVFGMVARGIPEKGWESAIRSILAMKDSKNVHLILVGASTYLDSLKKKYSDKNNIHFVGYSSNPLYWVKCFDIGLLPTVYGESLPTSIIEYLYCGKPVIATDIGEIDEMLSVDGYKAGLIVGVHNNEVDHYELVKAMEYFHQNPDKWVSFSTLALEASEKFSMEKCVSAYDKMYRDLLSSYYGTWSKNGKKPGQKNILLIIPELGPGGAERSISKLSQLLSRSQNVYICINNLGKKTHYPIGGQLINLGLPPSKNIFHKTFLWLRRIYSLKKIKHDLTIDISISFMEGASYLNVITKYKDKIVVSLRGSYYKHPELKGLKGFVRKNILIPLLFRKADKVVAMGSQHENEMKTQFCLPSNKIAIIPNFYDISKIRDKSNEPMEKQYALIFKRQVIVCSGRFHFLKSHKSLITVYKEVLKDYECSLILLGDGALKRDYIVHCRDLGLNVCDYQYDNEKTLDTHFSLGVYLLGYQENPFKFIRHSDLFILSSSWGEGFPNALAEAIICGVPVVSSDCRTGPREILAPKSQLQLKEKLYDRLDTPYGSLLPVLGDQPNKLLVSLWKDTIINYLVDRQMAEKKASLAYERIQDYDMIKVAHKWFDIMENAN